MTHRAPLQVVPYDTAWPNRFSAERDRLLAALPDRFRLEHVGSTAVPGLDAKPIIDMMLGAADLCAIDAVLPVLAALGYDHRPEHEVAFPERRFLAYPLTRPREFHLHAVAVDGPFWREHLQFRDRLRADAALAQQYAGLKHALAAHHGDDREAYTAAKAPFILGVLRG